METKKLRIEYVNGSGKTVELELSVAEAIRVIWGAEEVFGWTGSIWMREDIEQVIEDLALPEDIDRKQLIDEVQKTWGKNFKDRLTESGWEILEATVELVAHRMRYGY